jgi:hypothetical protein
MARGFESKDVEFQQAEAERSRPASAPLTAVQRDDAERRRALELTLARARTELEATASPIRKGILADAIADLVRRLESETTSDPAVDAR